MQHIDLAAMLSTVDDAPRELGGTGIQSREVPLSAKMPTSGVCTVPTSLACGLAGPAYAAYTCAIEEFPSVRMCANWLTGAEMAAQIIQVSAEELDKAQCLTP